MSPRMRISIINIQSAVPIRKSAVKALATHLSERMVAAQVHEWSELSIMITDDAGITRVKGRCFGRHISTDVVSTSYAPIPGDDRDGWTAEVIVNAQRAAEVARRVGRWSPARELALYIAHGIDHLCGGRDRTAHERRSMRRRELRWLGDADSALAGVIGSIVPGSGARRNSNRT